MVFWLGTTASTLEGTLEGTTLEFSGKETLIGISARLVAGGLDRPSASSCSMPTRYAEVAAVAMHGTPVCAGVVITGGAAGVGYAYADEFLARGHQARCSADVAPLVPPPCLS